jgi:hypothetical protein
MENEMTDQDTIEIRALGVADAESVARLAERDTRSVPPVPLIGGIVDGRLLAARSLANGESIADPFLPTAEVRSLLAKRAAQLRRGHGLLSRIRGRISGAMREPAPASEGLR